MRYRILGPLSVTVDGQPVAITAGRDRVLLAMLLLRAGRVVGRDRLVDAIWGDDPPSTARAQLQACVSRLRRRLPSGAIATDPAGYRLLAGKAELDAYAFDDLVADGRAAGDPALLRTALDLWRGDALVGIDSRPVRSAAAALDDRYAAIVEEWAELELTAGHGRDLIGELSRQAERFPLRERLRGQLIRALADAGRTADALAEFRRARDTIRDELGIEPGRDLQELHRQVLSGAEGGKTQQTAVRSLPRTVGDFTGREEVVARLLARLDRSDPAVVVIDGMAGSGKTTLALHVAALVGDRYPDAHLFVDLHGYGEHEPVEPSAALLTLLRQLGVAAKAIPAEPDGRVTLWRTELSRRRALVVLDNAYSSAQLADLLPAAPGTLALVTSRRRLAGLDDVHPESLPVLDEDEATSLLATIAGDRVRAEPGATAEVVRRCGGLPLALRLAGARLAHRPRWRVSDLVRRLGESALPELAAEDRSVASAFALSYQQLAEPAKRLFRLLGLRPAPLFDALTAAALGGLPLDETQDLLDDLVDAHLVDEPEPGVFRLHDLLREYAAALAADLPAEQRRDALVAVLDLQTYAFVASMPQSYHPMLRQDLGSAEPLRPDLLAALADPVARLEWERPQLIAYVEAAAAAGEHRYAWWIPRAAWWYVFSRGYGDDLRLLLRRALAVATEAGDRQGIAVVANYLASVYCRMDDYPVGLELLDRSLRAHEELGNRRAVATVLGNRAGVHVAMGRFADGVDSALESLRVRHLAGDRTPTRVPLHNLAQCYFHLGRHADALRVSRLALLSAIDTEDVAALAQTINGLQRAKRELRLASGARLRRYLAVALRLAVSCGHLGAEADSHNELGILLRQEGAYAEAAREHEAALETIKRAVDRLHGAVYLNDLAITRRLAGDPAGALELHRQALAGVEGRGMRYVEARARAGMADCLTGTDPDRAAEFREAARAAFREMGGTDHLRPADRRGTMVG